MAKTSTTVGTATTKTTRTAEPGVGRNWNDKTRSTERFAPDGTRFWLHLGISDDDRKIRAFVNGGWFDRPYLTSAQTLERALATNPPEPWLTVLQLIESWEGHTFSWHPEPVPPKLAALIRQHLNNEITLAELGRIVDDPLYWA